MHNCDDFRYSISADLFIFNFSHTHIGHLPIETMDVTPLRAALKNIGYVSYFPFFEELHSSK